MSIDWVGRWVIGGEERRGGAKEGRKKARLEVGGVLTETSRYTEELSR